MSQRDRRIQDARCLQDWWQQRVLDAKRLGDAEAQAMSEARMAKWQERLSQLEGVGSNQATQVAPSC